MKKKLAEFVASLGGSARYSGKCRTLFIDDQAGKMSKSDIKDEIIKKFGRHLPVRIA